MKKTTLHKLFCGAMLVVASSTAVLAQGTISTIAGTGLSGLSGDGGPALGAELSSPSGVAVDRFGNVFVADKSNHRIRVISSTSGNISTYAGSTAGLSGMGGPATLAKIKYPISVFLDASGELLITGWYNDMAFSIDPTTGYIAARCGCGHQGSSGDGGPACLAKTMTPTGSCEDAFGNTYVADNGSNRIRRVDAATGIITTIVNGTGAFGYSGDGGPAIDAQMSRPSSVFVDPSSPGAGHLYFSDGNNNVIRKVDLNTGIITTVAGTGTAGFYGNWVLSTDAKLRNPGSIYITNTGDLYFCDRGNNMIRKFNTRRFVITTVAGTGTAGFSGDDGNPAYAQLNSPQGVWVDRAENIYIADAGNQRIRKISAAGTTPLTPKQGVTGNTAGNIEVYPNPASGVFNISVGENDANANITVLNVLGAEIYNANLNGQLGQVNLSNFPAGTYTLVVKSANGKHTEKLTKQ